MSKHALIVGAALVLAGLGLHAEQPQSNDVVRLLMGYSRPKGTLSDAECLQVANRGQEALPAVLDLLAGRPPFREYGDTAAMRILCMMRNPAALPALRDYVARPGRNPMLALRTMLEIQNDAAMRDYAVKCMNELPYNPFDFFVPHFVLSPLPETTIVDIALRAHFPDYVFFRLAMHAADARCAAVLRAYSKSRPDRHAQIINGIVIATKTQTEFLDGCKACTTAPQYTQKAWDEEEWQAYRKSEIKQLEAELTSLRALMQEFK